MALKAAPLVDQCAGSAEMRYCGGEMAMRSYSWLLVGKLTLVVLLFILLLEASRNTFRPSPRSM